MNNYSKEIITFKDLNVEKVKIEGKEKFVYVTGKILAQNCPWCGKLASKSKGYGTTRIIKYVDLEEYHTYLVYKPKRLRCECGKSFTIKCNEIQSKSRISKLQKEKILYDLATKESLKEIAKRNNVSITKVTEILDMISYPLDEIGEVVCIDDFKGNLGGVKFQTVMCNPETGKITNIYPTRYKEDLLGEISKIPRYKRDKVKFYICDMNKTYIDVGKLLFRNAKIVIDKFHYTQLITQAFEKIRKRVQSNLSDKERKKFKHNRFVLLKRENKLKKNEKIDEYKKLDAMLNTSKELENAYIMLQKFYKINKMKEKEEVKKELIKYQSKCEEFELEEFVEALKTINKYFEYILNAFDTQYTNGFTEGINNLVKSIKRIGFGYRNKERFLKRMMHIQAYGNGKKQ